MTYFPTAVVDGTVMLSVDELDALYLISTESGTGGFEVIPAGYSAVRLTVPLKRLTGFTIIVMFLEDPARMSMQDGNA